MHAWLPATFDALFDAAPPRLRAWLGATRNEGYGPEEASTAQTVMRHAWKAVRAHEDAIFRPLAETRTFSEQAIRLYVAVERVRALQAPTLRALRKAAPDEWMREIALRTQLGTDTALRATVQTYANALGALADEVWITRGLLDESALLAVPYTGDAARTLGEIRRTLRFGADRLVVALEEGDSTAGAGYPASKAIQHAVARAHGEGPYSRQGIASTWRRYTIPAAFAAENHATERARAFRMTDALILGLLAYGGRRTAIEATARMSEADARTFLAWKDEKLRTFRFDHEKPARKGAHAEQSALVDALRAAEVDPVYGLRLPFRVVVEATRYPTDLAAMRTVGANLLTPTDRADALTLIAATLARGREQARRYYPTLFADLPRVDWQLYNARGVKTPGGNYLWPTGGEPARINVYLQIYAKSGRRNNAPAELLQVLVHEGAHHIWRTKLNTREQAFWADLVTQRAPIDYDAILAALETPWPPPAPPGWRVVPYVAADGPTVYGARWGEHDLFPIWRDLPTAQHRAGGGLLEYDADEREPLDKLAARTSLRTDFYRAEGFDVSDTYVRDYAVGRLETRRKTAVFLRVRGTNTARFPTFDPARDRWQYPSADTSLVPLLPTIKEANPKVYLQILIASSKYDPDYWQKNGASAWSYLDPSKGDPKPLWHYTIPEIEALRDKQEATSAPVFPVSGYGATNPEEAFCDALGLYVAYGPGTVLEPVREILFRLAPQVRRNPASDSTSDT